MKPIVTAALIGLFVTGITCDGDCGSSCNNKADVPVCVCQGGGGGHGNCLWLESVCLWEECYKDEYLLMPNSICDKNTKLKTQINEDAVPPYSDNGRDQK